VSCILRTEGSRHTRLDGGSEHTRLLHPLVGGQGAERAGCRSGRTRRTGRRGRASWFCGGRGSGAAALEHGSVPIRASDLGAASSSEKQTWSILRRLDPRKQNRAQQLVRGSSEKEWSGCITRNRLSASLEGVYRARVWSLHVRACSRLCIACIAMGQAATEFWPPDARRV
jgi:hypothetical protein